MYYVHLYFSWYYTPCNFLYNNRKVYYYTFCECESLYLHYTCCMHWLCSHNQLVGMYVIPLSGEQVSKVDKNLKNVPKISSVFPSNIFVSCSSLFVCTMVIVCKVKGNCHYCNCYLYFTLHIRKIGNNEGKRWENKMKIKRQMACIDFVLLHFTTRVMMTTFTFQKESGGKRSDISEQKIIKI